MARLNLQLFGGFRAWLQPGGLVRLPTRKAEALLAYLALPLGRSTRGTSSPASSGGIAPRPGPRVSPPGALPRPPRHRRPRWRLSPARWPTGSRSTGRRPVDVAASSRRWLRAAREAWPRPPALYQGDLLAGLDVARAALRGVAARASASACASSPSRRWRACSLSSATPAARGRGADRAPARRARSAAGSRAPDAHAAVPAARPPRGRARGSTSTASPCSDASSASSRRSRPSSSTSRCCARGRRRPRPRTPRPARPRRRPVPAIRAGPARRRHAADRPRARAGPARRSLDEARSRAGAVVAIDGRGGYRQEPALAELVGRRRAAARTSCWAGATRASRSCRSAPGSDALRSGGMVRDDAALETLEPVWRAELARLFPELAAAGLPARATMPGGCSRA